MPQFEDFDQYLMAQVKFFYKYLLKSEPSTLFPFPHLNDRHRMIVQDSFIFHYYHCVAFHGEFLYYGFVVGAVFPYGHD